MSASPYSVQFAEAVAPVIVDDVVDLAVKVMPGKRYDRIAVTYPDGRAYVHAFVDRETGDLLKPGGWAGPQRNAAGQVAVRYNLATPEGMREAIAAANYSGSYLYAK